MKPFDRLARITVTENASYVVNEKGRRLIERYYELVTALEEAVAPVIAPFLDDDEHTSKDAAVQIIASINSQQVGTDEFDTMLRLDTLTKGGNQPIDNTQYTFNPKDPILLYLEES